MHKKVMEIYKIENNSWVKCSYKNICLDDYNTCVLYNIVDKKVIPYGIGITSPKREYNFNRVRLNDVVIVNFRGINGNEIKTAYITHIDIMGVSYSFEENNISEVWNCFNNNFISFKQEFDKIYKDN